jgi:hypothetical protein
MCNAYTHPPGCRCGFGGDGHLGSGGNYNRFAYRLASPPVETSWRYEDDDFCRPTTCPKCGAEVYFVRHNGGSVWFDELGFPWPKHECFDDDKYGHAMRSSLTEHPQEKSAIFGIIIKTVSTDPGKRGIIFIRCSDGSLIQYQFNTEIDLATIVGSLVIVEHGEIKKIFSKYRKYSPPYT